MGAPKGNKNAKGNKGGTPVTKYNRSFATVAKKLCEMGATNADLAVAFDVVLATIWNRQVTVASVAGWWEATAARAP